MKKIIILLLIVVFLVGCEYIPHETENISSNSTEHIETSEEHHDSNESITFEALSKFGDWIGKTAEKAKGNDFITGFFAEEIRTIPNSKNAAKIQNMSKDFYDLNCIDLEIKDIIVWDEKISAQEIENFGWHNWKVEAEDTRCKPGSRIGQNVNYCYMEDAAEAIMIDNEGTILESVTVTLVFNKENEFVGSYCK